MVRLEVTHGLAMGSRHESAGEVVRLGRAAGKDVVGPDELVCSEHARIVYGGDRYFLRDLRSTNGTSLLRSGKRIALDDGNGREMALEPDDLIELGNGERVVRIAVTLTEDGDAAARVLAVRRIDELGHVESAIEREEGRLATPYDAQKRIGAARDLSEVMIAICDAAFALAPGATHVTVVLRDEDEEGARAGAASYLPIVTRVRHQQGPATQPIAITRSVFRKVVIERAAVIAADAPLEMAQTESLMGAQIRSVLAVPLWKGEEILGVLQMDNRQSTGVFSNADLAICAVLAHHASLAVANARLVRRLRAAEERLKKENAFLKTREESRRLGRGQRELVRTAPPTHALLEQLAQVMGTPVPVLIEGQTGV